MSRLYSFHSDCTAALNEAHVTVIFAHVHYNKRVKKKRGGSNPCVGVVEGMGGTEKESFFNHQRGFW